MEGLELICFEIITNVGTAKSFYVEAIQKAKAGDFEAAKGLIEDGVQAYAEGHHAHTKLILEEAQGNSTAVTLLLLHAEDQMMSAETVRIMAEEFVELYQKLA